LNDSSLDINATFRGGGRSIEFLDEINKASIVMLAETGIIPKVVAYTIARMNLRDPLRQVTGALIALPANAADRATTAREART
jgi:hypothetical protein